MYNQEHVVQQIKTLIDQHKFGQVRLILLNLINNNKNNKISSDVYFYLTIACEKTENINEAKKFIKIFSKLHKDKNPVAFNILGNIHVKQRNTLLAEKCYLKAIDLNDNYINPKIGLVILYQFIGRIEEAKKIYLKLIILQPKLVSHYFNLGEIDNNFLDKEKLKEVTKIIKHEKLDSKEMACGFFCLARYEKKQKNFDKEMEYLEKAHQLTFNSEITQNTIFRHFNLEHLHKYNKNFSFIKEDINLKNFSPIFIIGLPRTGSSMIESILSSGNRKIENLGETAFFQGIIMPEIPQGGVKKTYNKVAFVNEKQNLTVDIELFTEQLLRVFSNVNYNLQNKIFIDKSLDNFNYIDLILKVFPNAKFINTFRNVEDNIFAIYQTHLADIAYAHSLTDILIYVDHYLKTIDHFKKKYPDKILSINLEELTNNPEEQSKKLYSFCNFEWSAKALDYHLRKDLFIKTASFRQVREKVTKYDNKKYKPYKKFLKSFLQKYHWLNKE